MRQISATGPLIHSAPAPTIYKLELIGRGEKIRTSDPLHPMQVRYQAAPRPDRKRMIAEMASGGLPRRLLAAQDFHELFELETHLVNELLALVEIHLRVVSREAIARAADGEALLV
jgi:hypothetical protein